MLWGWSAGCATGQQVCTLAMVLAELMGPEEFRERVPIYATDVDKEGLTHARDAAYDERETGSIPAALLERYFERRGKVFTFRTDLRRSMIFGRNDLAQDAPISRVDLLVCHYAPLLHLTADDRARILARFHFALTGAGTLFLGEDEPLLSHSRLFTPIDPERRFFRATRAERPGRGEPGRTVVAGLWSEVEERSDHHLLRLRGGLSLATVPRARAVLGKLLHDPGAVLVDLAEVELAWDPAAEIFPAALAAAGGWPRARLVLTGAGGRLAERLRALRIDRTVPLVEDPALAPAQLYRRPDRVARHRDLPVVPGAPSMARALVHQACEDWSTTAAEDAAALVASELVSNAVQHAHSSCRVSVAIEPAGLRVGVRDYAPGPALRPRPVDATRVAGRGLHLVAMLSSAWGVQLHTDGKTTWALISLPA